MAYTEGAVKSPYPSLLFPEFMNRDLTLRWENAEKKAFAKNVRDVWEKAIPGSRREKIVNFEEIVKRRRYKDNEPNAVKSADISSHSKPIDILANLQITDDVLALRAFLNENDSPESTLATRYFPLERNDRPAKRKNKRKMDIGTEVMLLRQELLDMAISRVRRMIISNSHSPAFAYFLLEAGIPVVDVISLPGMFDFALTQGFFKDKTIIPVTGDDGAGAMGELVESLAGENNVNCESSLHAYKIKDGNKTNVFFDQEQIKRIKGKTAVIPEDILATGGTLESTAKQLLSAGAEEVIIMVAYPLFANGALKKLGNVPGIKIITTDGFTPQHNIKHVDNIYMIQSGRAFAGVLELDRQGINLFSEHGKKELRKLGFCINPWMEM